MRVFTGTVIEGSQRAAALGYPTINIPLEDTSESGVYAATVRIAEATYVAAAFADPSRKLLEAHLIDFSGALYGRQVSVELVHKIRDTRYFDNDEALKEVIREDIAKVREYFKN